MRETESLLIAAQNNAVRLNHIKAKITNAQQNSKCRLCSDTDEMITRNNKWVQQIGLVSLFNGISTLFRLFNAKAILQEEQYYLTHSWEDKGVHTFSKGICPKVNIIARLENELAYYDSAVHRFNHYTTRTPPRKLVRKEKEESWRTWSWL